MFGATQICVGVVFTVLSERSVSSKTTGRQYETELDRPGEHNLGECLLVVATKVAKLGSSLKRKP